MVGFTNEGNSCYFNSALSCFLYTPYIANNYKLFDEDNAFVHILKKTLYNLFLENFNYKQIINTKELLDSFKSTHSVYNNYEQHDSHEIYMCFTELLPEKLKSIYRGEFNQFVQCTKCSNVSTKSEEFNTLLLNDKGNFENCLRDFFAVETIEDYKCEKCNELCVAKLSRTIEKCPKVLVIKTRSHNPLHTLKLGALELELYAASIYNGNSRSGHYTSCVKSYNTWYAINDNLCVPMNNPVQIHNTCTLFYKCTLAKTAREKIL